MERTITAIFEDGVFKPSVPLDLPPHTSVRLTLEYPDIATSNDDRDWEEFEKHLDEISFDSGGPIPTRDELHDRH